MDANKMDRGSEPLRTHLTGVEQMAIRQKKKGWLQECLGCEAQSEFRFFINDNHVFEGKDEGSCLCRFCCSPIYPYQMVVKELNTEAEVMTIDRPFRCGIGACKCCCYQEASFASGGNELGTIQETCWWCIPTFKIRDHTGEEKFLLHQPTCCLGMCVNCCAEGNPCGKGCCKVSFRLYPAGQEDTNGDAPYDGMILRKPKSLATELFTDADAFDVDFPKDSTPETKAMVMGTAIFINSNFFEGGDEGGGDGLLSLLG